MTLTINRQIFFCLARRLRHAPEPNRQPRPLFTQLSQAMKAFYDETVALGISDKVTTFTLSDFGRRSCLRARARASARITRGAITCSSWAASVLGGDFYGMNTSNGTPYPTCNSVARRYRQSRTLDSDDGCGPIRGDAATWYGLSGADLGTVFRSSATSGRTISGFCCRIPQKHLTRRRGTWTVEKLRDFCPVSQLLCLMKAKLFQTKYSVRQSSQQIGFTPRRENFVCPTSRYLDATPSL